jgi:hypothetical protein
MRCPTSRTRAPDLTATAPLTDSQRVVVTGLGATTPLGGDVPSTWSAMLAGRSGVKVLTEDWV